MKVSKLLEQRKGGIYSLRPDATVAECVEELNRKHVGAIAVMGEDGVLQGLVSERHILRNAYDPAKKTFLCDRPVKDVMRAKAETPTIGPETNLRRAMEIMAEQRTRHIVVVDEQDHVLGCISIRDIVEELLNLISKENVELQNFMYGY